MRHLMRYLARQGSVSELHDPPSADLAMAVVIPCYAESGIIETLSHLQQRCPRNTEIIVVVNHARNAPAWARARNRRTLSALAAWRKATACSVPVQVIDACELPPKHAGVGLARKIGMDAAALRFCQLQRPDGLIASLDADCRVSIDYGARICAYFDAHPSVHAATLDCAHRLQDCVDARHRQAMIYYELFLRYLALGWRYAGLPYAFMSIGSCFAVRANAYARHGGMNRRKAGEDFYFLHKLARERPLAHISGVSVYPSPRMEARAPFGTGQAVSDWYRSGAVGWPVVAPACFDELRRMNVTLPELFADRDEETWLASLAPTLSAYLQHAGIARALPGMYRHARSLPVFRRHFYTWFDGLRAWRYAQRYADTTEIERAVPGLLAALGAPLPAGVDGAEMLLTETRKQFARIGQEATHKERTDER